MSNLTGQKWPMRITNRLDELVTTGQEIWDHLDDVDVVDRRAWMLSAVTTIEAICPVGSRHREYAESCAVGAYRIDASDIAGVLGTLKSVADECHSGLLGRVEMAMFGGAFVDFLLIARTCLERDLVRQSAVLASAVFEDTVKRLCKNSNIESNERGIEELLDALKSSGVLTKATSKRLKGLVGVRNAAFHANWDGLERIAVSHLIESVEEIVEAHFAFGDDVG